MVQYYTASSLDGFLATPDDSLDWLLSLGDVGETSYPNFIANVGAIVMGSATYEWLLKHSDGWTYSQPAWVFSNRDLPRMPGADVRMVRGDVRPVYNEIMGATGGRSAWIVGGGDLAGQFFDAGLLDQIIVTFAPVTLGEGKPLLPRQISGDRLKLQSIEQFGPFAELRYDVIGERPL
jgi:dihydrofolate reductase